MKIFNFFRNLFSEKKEETKLELPPVDLYSCFAEQAERNFMRLNSLARLKYGDDVWLNAPFDRDVYEVKRQNEVIATFRKDEFVDKILAK